jgi:hypothetical protein
MARPQKDATLTAEQIEQLASFGCTDDEIATLAGLSESQLKASFRPLLKRGRTSLRTNLRSAQVKKALGFYIEQKGKDGNIDVYLTPPDNTMLIWLGKQYLNQRDKQELTGKDGDPLFKIYERSDDFDPDAA